MTNRRLNERTRDYAQTKRGTIWHFGERTAALNRPGGMISREGSLPSGVDGAQAGGFMAAAPRPGPCYFQEVLRRCPLPLAGRFDGCSR